MMSDMRVILLLPVLAGMFMFSIAYGDVRVPGEEFAGYFDSDGIYTIVGVVQNTEDYSIISHVDVTVIHDGKPITVGQDLPSVAANKDMPFKIRIPEVKDQNIVLESPVVTFSKSTAPPPSEIHVLYDRTLVRYPDGHLTGRITNDGNDTKYDIKVYAAIHGINNKFLDTGTNMEKIEKIEPGQTISFTIYPDPTVSSDVKYYSCFNIGDTTVIPLRAMRNGVYFNFRYDSTAAFTVDGFDSTGTKLSLNGINSFKLPTYVNFEFPRTSDGEKFDVLVNGEPVKFIQSRDDEGNWHVAFDVDSSTQDVILISGFENPNVDVSPSGNDLNYAPFLYVIPVVAAIGIGAYFYKRKN